MSFSVIENISEEAIKRKVDDLGNKPLTIFSHGYTGVNGIKLMDSAKESGRDYTKNSKQYPAIAIMDVILAAHRDYNKQVEKHVACLRKNYQDITFKKLKDNYLNKMNYIEFKEVWGHKDEKKYEILKELISAIFKLGNPKSKEEDFLLMKDWAKNSSIDMKVTDPVGKIKHIGLATFQHLRMTFGIDTVKPDQRVKEVLENEFNQKKLSSENAIIAAEQIAKIVKLKPLVIDQLFVKYGSGYYRSETKAIKEEVQKIIEKLLLQNVSKEKIANATNWSLSQINSLKISHDK